MPRRETPTRFVSHISVEPQQRGLKAVYLVEAESDQDERELGRLFEQFEPMLESVQLCSGKLVAYAVQLHSEEQSMLDELEQMLRANFVFVILHRSFDQLIYDIVRELCKDSGSKLGALPRCDICRRPEPFPEVVVKFADNEGHAISTRGYCATCAAESGGRNNKEFVISLLQADRGKFADVRNVTLVRNRSKKQLAFRIDADAEHQFLIG
jgi:hypothetical protein